MRAHPLRSIPGYLWFQFTHPPQQQNGEQHNDQAERNTNDIHKATLLGESRTPMGLADCCLAETPKVGELQMSWLRSEDLKEEKNVTAPVAIIAVAKTLRPPLPSQQQTDDFLVIMNLTGDDASR
jgi:hypothetical protein